jgi:4-diphosphocytidyl-2-C-methyl-D-erythritol kinase
VIDRVVREFAPAKVNLFLHVGERRVDGFHAVQSLVAFASIGDELKFEHSDKLRLTFEGPCAAALEGETDNLVLRAAEALAEEMHVEPAAKIVLSKNLPVSSGIGGGSADAAATLRGLERLWRINPSDDARAKIAASLGSDVPVCLASVPSWMEGRGERVTPAGALPPLAIVLVNPRIAVSTPKIFAGLRTRRGVGGVKPAGWSSALDLFSYLKATTNDLEAPARVVAPAIGEVLEALADCPEVLLVRMSGSGATCFGLFGTDHAATVAAKQISARHSDWWVGPARLNGRSNL